MKTAKELRAQARMALKGRYWWAFLASLIAMVLGGVAGSSGGSAASSGAAGAPEGSAQFQAQMDPETTGAVLAVLAGVLGVVAIIGIALMIVGSAVELGYDAFNIELYKTNEKPAMGMLFSRFSIFGKALWLRILMYIKILLWTLLFVIPGIIAAYRYALAPYLLAENPDLTAKEAIDKSKELMNGHKWRLFCLQWSFIGWVLLCLLTAGVGAFFLQPYIKAAETAFYMERVNGVTGTPAPEAVPTAV